MEILLYVFAAAAVLGLLLIASFGKTEMERMAGEPVVAIRDVPEGAVVRIVGTAVPAEAPLLSPVREATCLAWQLSVTARSAGLPIEISVGPVSVGGNQSAETLLKADWAAFYVEDGTGRALVRTDALELALRPNRRERPREHEVIARRLAAFLAAHLPGGKGTYTPEHWSEGTLTEGETVSIQGRATWEGQLLIITAPGPGEKVLVSESRVHLPNEV
ncbi:MAG: hypothetical protein RL653_4564 [Pseudomonadota bacterium]|jgi:hypothetical protein